MRALRLFTLIAIVLCILLNGCSIKQNTITSNIYHNVTAHYNGYYYARKKIQEIEKSILEDVNNDYNRIPLLYPKLDSALTSQYSKDTQEVIKMASISIKRHPNSKWLYHNYTMIGLARLYSYDFKNAIQTFKYINTKSRDSKIRHTSLIYLIRTLIAKQDYDGAKGIFQFLEKEKLNKKNEEKLYLEKAYYHQMVKDYNKMAQSLRKADISLTQKEGKGRIYFINGKVHQKIGLNAEAYNYYKKCIASNPAYAIDLNARLGMLQTTPLDDEKDIKKVGNEFIKALEDAKNEEFQGKIYYEIAEFEKKQEHLYKAIANYKLSVQTKGNEMVKGYSFLQLGNLYFNSLQEYTIAKKYYDSTISLLPKDTEHYSKIEERQKVLKELVYHMGIVKWQDSLLQMTLSDSSALRLQITSTLKERQKQKQKKIQKTKENSNVGYTPITKQPNITPGWYFENPSIVSLGKLEFQQVWGHIRLEDNWRRSNKVNIQRLNPSIPSTATKQEVPSEISPKENVDIKIEKIIAQLPVTESQKQKTFSKIEEAYFNIGEILQFQLDKEKDAIKSYVTIIDRFPESKRIPEALYRVCLIDSDSYKQTANYYCQQLVSSYPNSDFTKVFIDPNYRKKQYVILEHQKKIYQEAYKDFKNNHLNSSQEKIDNAFQLGETEFTPQLELLDILITGKTELLSHYQLRLDSFLIKYLDTPLKDYAKKLLISSKNLQHELEKFGAIRYTKSHNESHYFAIVYPQQSLVSRILTNILNMLIQKGHIPLNPIIYHKILDDNHMITLVSEFSSVDLSFNFLNKFNTYSMTSKGLLMYPLNTFVITKNNSEILQQTKALNEYLAFFDRNYKNKIGNLPK